MLAQCQMLSDNADDEAQSEAIDSIIGVGERLAARIVAGLLRQNNLRGVAIDATDLIITDNVYGHATPNLNLSRDRIAHNLLPMLDRGIIPVITGFIGSTTAGKPTTLGRGGSDYTASVLAVCTDADEVWIWTDVDGMMTTDPRQISDARLIPTLTYDEVAELAYFGARILHPRMIGPLRDRQIPLRVRNVFKPQHSGSLIVPDNKKNASPPALKAVTTIHGLGLLAEHSGPLSRVTAVVDDALFDITGSHADVMISAQSSSKTLACFVIPTSAGPDALHSLEVELEQRLREVADEPDWSTRPLTIVTAIGARLNEQHPLVARTLEALEDIRVWALSQGPAHCSLSMVVEPKDADAALRQIHDLILRTDSGTDPAPKA
jgi:aspartate kinase